MNLCYSSSYCTGLAYSSPWTCSYRTAWTTMMNLFWGHIRSWTTMSELCFVSCHNTILQGITVILSPYLIICTIIINHITLSKAIKDQEADFPMEKSVWCESSGRRMLTLWLQYAHRFEEICKRRQNTASWSTLNNSMNACVLQRKVDKIKIAHTHTDFWLASTPTIQPFKF